MINQAVYLSHGFVEYASEILRSRRLIFDLTRREFRSRYLGSAFGLIWAFIHPATMMVIYWIVFQYALRNGPMDGIPFVVWLLSGLVPWFFVSDSIATGGTVILENRFLVKKVVFRVSLLPVVRLLSLLPIHLFFMFVLVLICWADGYPPTLYTLQILYYLAAFCVLATGLSWLISALVPFLKDLAQVVVVILQVFFWLTPIVWNVQIVPPNRIWIFFLNPLFYIIQGYRDSLIGHVWFWHHPLVTAYYWAIASFIFALGGMVFLRMRSHFADVL